MSICVCHYGQACLSVVTNAFVFEHEFVLLSLMHLWITLRVIAQGTQANIVDMCTSRKRLTHISTVKRSSPKCVVNSAWFNFGLHKVLLVMQIRV
jgi:hypothetical protein